LRRGCRGWFQITPTPKSTRHKVSAVGRPPVDPLGVPLSTRSRAGNPQRANARRKVSCVATAALAATRPRNPTAPLAAHPAVPTDAEDDWDAEALAFERQRLIEALEDAGSNKSQAARLLRMPRSTFVSKLQKHGLT
jgi:DNA-binding NtrC family response regulator